MSIDSKLCGKSPTPYDTTNIRALGGDNFYAVKLSLPKFGSKDDLYFKETTHLFTENELVRASRRLAVDRPTMDPTHVDIVDNHDHRGRGIVGLITYINRNDVLTTRYIVRLDLSHIPTSDNVALGTAVVCMFTAREIRRSIERGRWVNESLWHLAYRWLRKKARKALCLMKSQSKSKCS